MHLSGEYAQKKKPPEGGFFRRGYVTMMSYGQNEELTVEDLNPLVEENLFLQQKFAKQHIFFRAGYGKF